MWRDKALCQIHQSFNSAALLMKRQIIYEKLFNFSRWFILTQVITIHQVKSLPSAWVSILIPEFGYTISLDYSALPWNMYQKRWFYLVFVSYKVLCHLRKPIVCIAKLVLNISKSWSQNLPEFLTSFQKVALIDHGETGSHLLFTCQIEAFIHHTKQLMFFLYTLQFFHAPWQ